MKTAVALLGLGATLAHAGFCNDKRTDCVNWAKDGECTGENQVLSAPPARPSP